VELLQGHFLAAARVAKRQVRRKNSPEEKKKGKGATARQRKIFLRASCMLL
jgi:hypothetical protein